jgi:hypothetical protein
MKREKVVVSEYYTFTEKFLENKFKDAVLAVDGSVLKQVAVDEMQS